MANLKNINQAKDLSNLAKTPQEKQRTEALEFIEETRQVIVAMAEQIGKLTQAMNEMYMRTDYLRVELSKLKGEDLSNGTESGKEGTEKVNNADPKRTGKAGREGEH